MFLGGRAPPVRKADLTAICEPIILTLCDQYLTALQVSTACYGDSFTFLYVDVCT
jgi:hypothetical protein